MTKLIYSTIASLDGYVEDASGRFDWAAPDEEVHAFVNDLERPIGTYLYGRRMYETMVFWETAGRRGGEPAVFCEYAEIWRAAERVVHSRTLARASTARTRIERDLDPGPIRRLKQSGNADLSVGGAELAGQALAAGLVDEIQLFLVPVIVGGGKRVLPPRRSRRLARMGGVHGEARTGALWSRGDKVALRDVWFGAVWRAIASIVIEDDGVTSVFWIPVDSAASYPADGAGREVRMPQREFMRATRRTPWACVVLCDSREPWTLWHFQASDGRFDHWYVNFEHYLGRTAIAYDSIDHKLDLIAHPDGSLEWKDEDELAAADRLGLVDAKAVRAEAQHVLAKPPWPTGWEDFEPDPGWGVAELPEGWERGP